MIDAATFESPPPIFCGGLAIVIITTALSAKPRLTSQGVLALREAEQGLITGRNLARRSDDSMALSTLPLVVAIHGVAVLVPEPAAPGCFR
jgi:hypothetical protein